MNDWRPFIYGGFASVAAECGTFPIDTTKTRLQIQGQKIDAKLSELKYRGMSHALFRIFREEGFHALYSGIAPALLRQATYGTIKIGVYYSLKGIYLKGQREESLPVNIFCGVIAGIVSSSIANPTDVLKVRMQARGEHDFHESMPKAFVRIYKQEGIPGLWRGVGPTAQRAATVAGVELPAYDISKKKLISSGLMQDTKSTHFLASFIAGFTGAVASTPIDVVKTRLMNQKRLKTAIIGSGGTAAIPNIYTSSTDCLIQTIRHEGFLALYKGFIPTWVRLGPWNIIFFMTYEQLKKAY